MAKKQGVYVKPSPEVVEHFMKLAERNRRTVADEIGLWLDQNCKLEKEGSEEHGQATTASRGSDPSGVL